MKERKLSNTDMNKVIMEKIPIKSRIDSVYLPIFAINIAEYAYKTLHDDLIIIGNKETREFDRQISNTFRRYHASNMKEMGGELYCCVMRNSEKPVPDNQTDTVNHAQTVLPGDAETGSRAICK
jgi:hypothetical protein